MRGAVERAVPDCAWMEETLYWTVDDRVIRDLNLANTFKSTAIMLEE